MMKKVFDTKWASLNVVITFLWISVFRNGFIRCSFQFSHSVGSDSLAPNGLQHVRLPCPSPTPGATQTHVHQVGDAIQSSHSLLSPSPPAFHLSQHQGLSQWISSLHQVDKVLELQLQHQSFQWIFRTVSFRIDRFDLLAVQGTLKSLLQHRSLCVDSLKGNFYTISSEPVRKKTNAKKKERKEGTRYRSKEG